MHFLYGSKATKPSANVLAMESHGGQAAAIGESIAADGSDTVADGHGGKAAAIRESIVADGGDAVGDGHRGKAAATRESRPADGGDAVGDGHRGKAAATRAFTNRFISVIYVLNGRKVMTCILKKLKKEKI